MVSVFGLLLIILPSYFHQVRSIRGANMSGDWMGGFAAARYRANRDLAEADSESASWRKHAKYLQKLLNNSEEDLLFNKVAFDANDYVLKLALEALQAANPSSSLLDKHNRDILRRKYIAVALSEKGYRYNVETGKVESKA